MNPNHSDTDILFEIKDRVAVITLHRPEKLNAFRSRTLRELTQAVRRAVRDGSVGIVVLTGSGSRAFCVGGDIEEMKALTPRTGKSFVAELYRTAEALLSCPKPTIAKVNGYCLGGGNELQLFCDLTVASDRSVFGQVGPKVGSSPLWGGSQILPALTGLKKAKELMFLCPQITAREAASLGLINMCVPEAELENKVREIGQNLLRKSPQSLRVLKKSLHRGLLGRVREDLKLLQSLYGSRELREGMQAFLDKREPRFR